MSFKDLSVLQKIEEKDPKCYNLGRIWRICLVCVDVVLRGMV